MTSLKLNKYNQIQSSNEKGHRQTTLNAFARDDMLQIYPNTCIT